MELATNLVWVIVAAASYALLLRHLAIRRAGHARGPSGTQCIIALTCVLAILFPVISLSDDLQEMQGTMEEATTSGLDVKKCVASQSSTPWQTIHRVLLIFAPIATSDHRAVLWFLASQKLPRTLPGELLREIGRSPPSFTIDQIS